MTPRALRAIVSTLAVVPVLLALAARPAPSAESRWDARLARLDPVRPMDYLELGEEVADQAGSDAERRLARELFGYAGALDPTRLGRSAMLALASIARRDPSCAPAVRARAAAIAGDAGEDPIVRSAARQCASVA
jgi:hypothetical protein